MVMTLSTNRPHTIIRVAQCTECANYKAISLQRLTVQLRYKKKWQHDLIPQKQDRVTRIVF